ncbi:hypothetical protein [Zongyangia hominis]|uniref:Uncharacterized protein n=1 Tax=Zongyangia hominis TaxID=2763677 RepID=A0A926ICE4_9FIRM|nr:hypothetical protein [Zongyangia hominis]MBC8571035.1 hypothetical protein [Zongyangia hominis]
MEVRKKKTLLSLLLLAAAIVLMALPTSAVLTFATSPTETVEKTFSYFNFQIFGMGAVLPPIIACLSVAAALITLWNLLAKEESAMRNLAAWILSLICLLGSLGNLLLTGSVGWAGIGIAVLLFGAFSMQKLA